MQFGVTHFWAKDEFPSSFRPKSFSRLSSLVQSPRNPTFFGMQFPWIQSMPTTPSQKNQSDLLISVVKLIRFVENESRKCLFLRRSIKLSLSTNWTAANLTLLLLPLLEWDAGQDNEEVLIILMTISNWKRKPIIRDFSSRNNKIEFLWPNPSASPLGNRFFIICPRALSCERDTRASQVDHHLKIEMIQGQGAQLVPFGWVRYFYCLFKMDSLSLIGKPFY